MNSTPAAIPVRWLPLDKTSRMNQGADIDFYNYRDKIFFNIFSYLPHDSIAEFLNKYSNLLFCRVSYKKGAWTAYPSNYDHDKRKHVTHLIQFESHPFISFNFRTVSLEINNSELEDDIQTQDLKILLNFWNKQEAITFFHTLCDNLEVLTKQKRVQIIDERYMVEFKLDKDLTNSTGVSMILGTNNFVNNDNCLLIYPDALRIHFLTQ